ILRTAQPERQDYRGHPAERRPRRRTRQGNSGANPDYGTKPGRSRPLVYQTSGLHIKGQRPSGRKRPGYRQKDRQSQKRAKTDAGAADRYPAGRRNGDDRRTAERLLRQSETQQEIQAEKIRGWATYIRVS